MSLYRCSSNSTDFRPYKQLTVIVGSAVLLAASGFCPVSFAHPGDEPSSVSLSPVVVEGRTSSLVEIAESASEGKVSGEELLKRPLLRTGEILETVPGLIVTQHSGSGKANQYFLRGFNLDHGTDFRTEVDGIAVNMATHAHGQGYTDLNFLIPELISGIDYHKGNYYAEFGDFSSAGAAEIRTVESLAKPFVSFESGSYEFARAVTGASYNVGEGIVTAAAEFQTYNGPWEVDEEARKGNLFFKYARRGGGDLTEITFMGYRGIWNSADQIPQRAVNSGLLDSFDVIDSTDGGDSYRYSANARYVTETSSERHEAQLYAQVSALDLYSNFTYFLDDPVNGDQFQQEERRVVLGGNYSAELDSGFDGLDNVTTLGLQARTDIIPEVALRKTAAREKVSTVRNDDVTETSFALYAKNEAKWTPKVRTNVGLRGDLFLFDVESNVDENSGNENDARVSPKAGIIFGPWSSTEVYVNGGFGFHSNDARGTTIRRDPVTGEPADKVDPLVRTRGAEAGVRTTAIDGLQSTLAVWVLDIDSELLFVGDAGVTEPSRSSERYGVELTNAYSMTDWASLEADWSLSHARFKEDAPEGDYIPGSIDNVVAGGVNLGYDKGLYSALRVRYFGPRPLIEDNSVESQSTLLVSGRVGYRWTDVDVWIEGFNLFDRSDSDIDYYYASRLPGEPDGGIEDVHFHPVEPISMRAGVMIKF